jgi:hypothetical protein
MGAFLSGLIEAALQPRVVHSLPGRIRIHVPVLEKLPPTVSIENGQLIEVLSFFPGIQSLSFSSVTGNLLIHYDTQQMERDSILNGLRVIGRTLIKHRQRLESLDREGLTEFWMRLKDYLKSHSARILENGKEVDLPDDLWP